MKNFRTYKAQSSKVITSGAAGFGFALLLLSGAAFAQDAATKANDAAESRWRTEWRKKWAASSRKSERETWRAAWRDEWRKAAQKAKPQASAQTAPLKPAALKPEIKTDFKAAPPVAPPIKPEVKPVTAPPAPRKTEKKAPPAAIVAAPKTDGKPAANAGTVPKTVAASPLVTPPAAPAPAAKSALPAPNPAAAPAVIPAAPIVAAPPAPANSANEKPAGGILSETRPDTPAETKKPVDKPLDSPLSAVGDGGRMFLYLIPTVLLMVGALHLLRRFQERNGRLPAFARLAGTQKISAAPAPKNTGLLQILLGGMNRNKTPERVSAIRIIESVPMGGSQLHLIEVRGRSLLLGTNANGVNLLTEVEESDDLVNNEFRLLLEQAAGDMDSLNLTSDALPSSLLIGALDEPMRDASRAVTRGTRRLRTVQETEAAWEQEQK